MRGRLIVVSGPSGAGKGTLIEAALDEVPELAFSVSATTRNPRPGEIDGRDYLFLSRETFEEWIEEGRFLEWAEYSDNLYGTPADQADEFLDAGRSVILDIELQGARQVRENRSDAVMIFVRAPDLEETRRRLEGRATETEEAIQLRMSAAQTAIAARDEFDYEIVNDDLQKSRPAMVKLVQEIVTNPDIPLRR
ncbi:MAG: guanylate kinase [Rubrobacteraceae bacterium]